MPIAPSSELHVSRTCPCGCGEWWKGDPQKAGPPHPTITEHVRQPGRVKRTKAFRSKEPIKVRVRGERISEFSGRIQFTLRIRMKNRFRET